MKKIKQKEKTHQDGFTLLEMLIVIGIIAILAAAVLVAINPARQFRLARDSQRTSNVTTILNAIGQDISENTGTFKCNGVATSLPATSTIMKSIGGFDIASCITPTYVAALPFDPAKSGAHFTSVTDYDSEYRVSQDVNGRVTVSADAELSTSTISATR